MIDVFPSISRGLNRIDTTSTYVAILQHDIGPNVVDDVGLLTACDYLGIALQGGSCLSPPAQAIGDL